MTLANDASTRTSKSPNPLNDDDLSELTKKEILFWARKLRLTPSELFTLTKDELTRHLEAVHKAELHNEERQARYLRWERISDMKRLLLEEQQKARLAGGQNTPPRRTIWDILCAAAGEIESMYGDSQEYSGPYSGGSPYESSSFAGFKTPPIPSMCSTIYEMHPEDSQYTPPDFPSTLSATPVSFDSPPHSNNTYNVCPPAGNATYNLSAANATFDVGRANATFDCPQGNATYNIGAGNATYNMGPAGNATYDVCPPGNATFNMGAANATYDMGPARNATFDVSRGANATYDVCPPGNATFNVGAANATYNKGPARNATFNVSRGANATYNVYPPGNATFNMGAANATYDVGPAGNATFNVTRGANATFDVCPPGNATFNAGGPNATFNASPARNRNLQRANVTFDVGQPAGPYSPDFRPNPVMASTPKRSPRTGRKAYFRNYTDYWMTLSGLGITEASHSISCDIFSGNKSVVRASARTYSLPHRSTSCPPSPSNNNDRTQSVYHSAVSSIQPPRRGERRNRSPVAAMVANYGGTPTARSNACPCFNPGRRLFGGSAANSHLRSRSVPPNRC